MNAVLKNNYNNANLSSEVATISAASPSSLHKATIPVTVNNYYAEALVDTGSSISFINEALARLQKLKRKPCQQTITLASLSDTSPENSFCNAAIQQDKHVYKNAQLLIVRDLYADINLDHDILKVISHWNSIWRF